jgi:hypothetical protein
MTRAFLPVSVLVVLAGLILLELVVLVPVIVTQRGIDQALVGQELQARTDDLANGLNETIARFMYNVVRAAAAAPKSGFLAQGDLEDAIQLQDDPRNTPELLYFWVPLVSAVERNAYEQFYGFNITQQRNKTGAVVVRAPNTPGRVFGPFTLFVPPLPPPPATNPDIYGFDLLSLATAPVNFRNVSRYLVVPATLVTKTQNNYGFVAVAQNKYGKGYMFGRVGSQELLEFSLTVPRKEVLLAAFVLSSNASRQALFYDDTPLLANATTVTAFDMLPG